MSQALAAVQTETPVINRERALRILSKSLYKDLRQNGYEPKQIVALASELDRSGDHGYLGPEHARLAHSSFRCVKWGPSGPFLIFGP